MATSTLEALTAYRQTIWNAVEGMTVSDVKYASVERPDGITLTKTVKDWIRELRALDREIENLSGSTGYGQLPDISNGWCQI